VPARGVAPIRAIDAGLKTRSRLRIDTELTLPGDEHDGDRDRHHSGRKPAHQP
jgi:hypothetical protein